MTNNTDLIETLEKHRQLELRNIKICQEREKQLKNPAAQLMLYQIRMDSTKHAYILQKLKEIIEEDIPEPIWSYQADRYIGQVSTGEELKKHAELEKEMIAAPEETIKKLGEEANLYFEKAHQLRPKEGKILADWATKGEVFF